MIELIDLGSYWRTHDGVRVAVIDQCVTGAVIAIHDDGRHFVQDVGIFLRLHRREVTNLATPATGDFDGLFPPPGPYCDARAPNGYACSRAPGHRGDHVAGNGDGSIAVRWPACKRSP
jgi:hypothetical protein